MKTHPKSPKEHRQKIRSKLARKQEHLKEHRAELQTEVIRKFNLRLYLSLTTGLATLLIGIGLWLLLSRVVSNNILLTGKHYAYSIARSMSMTIAAEKQRLAAQPGGPPNLEDPQAWQTLNPAIRNSMELFSVKQIQIYNRRGCVVYSTRPEQIGTCKPDDPLLLSALDGENTAQIQQSTQEDNPLKERLRLDTIEVYVPIGKPVEGEETPFPGVFEIHMDITPIRRTLLKANLGIIAVVFASMLLLFAVQLYFGHKADKIIRLQQAALEERTRQLESLQKIKEDLTNMIVHDMKNPLTAIMGYLKLLQKGLQGVASESQSQMLNTAHQASQRLLDMTMNLLDISRIEENKMPLKREPVALRELAGAVIQPFAPEIEETALHLAVEIPDDLAPLPADRDVLRRILTNLLSNAIKHTGAEGHITLRAAEHGSEVWISVQDDGEGIPAEAIPHLFQKFSQVENQQLGSKTDTGLGLAFCKLAVEAHGGRIWVESTPGAGSTFTCSLPTDGEYLPRK